MSGETMEKWLADAGKRIAELEADYRRQGNTVVEKSLRIAELEAENERLRTQVANPYVWEDFVEMRANDERYRWIRSQGATAYGELVHALMPWPSEQAINEAIDAAMEGK